VASVGRLRKGPWLEFHTRAPSVVRAQALGQSRGEVPSSAGLLLRRAMWFYRELTACHVPAQSGAALRSGSHDKGLHIQIEPPKHLKQSHLPSAASGRREAKKHLIGCRSPSGRRRIDCTKGSRTLRRRHSDK
jgi:hypothetical protein